MDWVSAKIALGGEQGHIMFRGPDRPVSWPEVRVLQHLHGDDNVFDCDFVRTEPMNQQMEKMRLLGIYGADVVNLIYPGHRPAMEMEFPGEKEPIGQKRAPRRLISDLEASTNAQLEAVSLPDPLPPRPPQRAAANDLDEL